MQFLPRRLYSQMFVLLALILTATFVSYSLLTSARQSAMLQKTMEKNASVMVENIADSSAHFLVLEDFAGLEDFILRSADLPDIDQIQVCEKDGTVIADVVRAGLSKPVARQLTPRLTVPDIQQTQMRIEKNRIIVWHPITAGGTIGWIKTAFSMHAIDEMRTNVWKNSVMMAPLWLLGSFVLLLLFLRPPLSAIMQLSQFARKLNDVKGKMISVKHGSLEIKQLEESLNYASRELHKTEHQLMAERERLDVTLQSIGDGVIATDISGNVVLMNKVAENLTGLTSQEAKGRQLNDVFHIIHEGTRASIENPAETLIKSPDVLRPVERTTLISRDGTEFSIAVSGAPIVGTDRTIVGAVLAFHDVTYQRKMREEREKLEEQLRQSQKMEAVGQLAGGIAHDFNNILSAIIGYASLLQMKMHDSDPLRPMVDPILESANRAASLTRSLLAFSRKQLVELKPIDINAIVSGIETILKRLIREDVEFHINVHPTKLIITADKGQIEQVLINLVTNARDAMPHGGKLTISTGTASFENPQWGLERGMYAVISVSDTGIGMNKQTQDRIFEPFFTTKEVGKGTGLGLSMVYGIVKQHNGGIQVNSEPGHGSSFIIYLPRQEQLLEERHPTEMHTAPQRGNQMILLVEDDPAVRKITRIMLEEFGYAVMEAVDSPSALDLYRVNHDRIHLVLTDIIMPKMDGRLLVKEIQQIRPDVKVLFMSGYTADIMNQQWPVGPGVSYVSKPLNPVHLHNKISSLLAQQP